MARQAGIITITGTIGNLTFYRSQDGMLVKEKSHISKARFMKDPSFERSRENMYEFKEANRCSKIFFDSIRGFRQSVPDNRVYSRLVSIMKQLLKEDLINKRGARTPANGLKNTQGKNLVRHFNFNKHALLGSVLHHPYIFNAATGTIYIQDILPLLHIRLACGATHVRFSAARVSIDFITGSKEICYSPPVQLPLNMGASDVALVIAATCLQADEATNFYFLKLEFLQQVNGVDYELYAGQHHVLELIEIV